MSGILRLESLTKGNTLKQGDKTPLKYRLFDADGEKLNIAGKSAKVRLVYPDFLTIGYEKDGLTVAQDDTVTFTIDKVIPAKLYHVEIIVDNKFIFPSRADESKFTVDKSSLGTESSIIEIVGVDAVVKKAVDLINKDPNLIIDEEKLVNDIIKNTGIGSIEEYYQQYSDVIKELSKNKDYHSLPEIAGARRGYRTLAESLGNLSVNMINKNLGKLDQSFMSEEFLQQMAGNTPINAVPADDTITTPKLVNKSVTAEKLLDTKSYSLSANMFDKTSVKKGGYYDATTGNWVSTNEYLSTHFIRVEEKKRYHRTSFWAHVTFWDKNLNYIDGYEDSARLISTPPDTEFVAISMKLGNEQTFMFSVVGQLPTTYTSYSPAYITGKSWKAEEGSRDPVELIGVQRYPAGINLFDKDDIFREGFFRASDGQWHTDSESDSSKFIEIKPNQTYRKKWKWSEIAFWDENFQFISGIGNSYGFKTPENAKYVTISVTYSDLYNYMLTHESDWRGDANWSGAYVPFEPGYKLDDKWLEGRAMKKIEKRDTSDLFLRVPTPYWDGTDDDWSNHQATHPSVVQFDEPWNGYKYWMAFTPYPHNQEALENPCVVGSNDGIKWESPLSLVNPIYDTPTDGYNSDTHIFYNSERNIIEVWWREVTTVSGQSIERILRKEIEDGIVSPTAEEMVKHIHDRWALYLLSPSIIYDEGQYKMWFSRQAPNWNKYLYYMTSVDGKNWTEPVIVQSNGENLICWHASVTRHNGVLHLLNHDDVRGKQIKYTKSIGGSDTNFEAEKVIIESKGEPWALDGKTLYRATPVFTDYGVMVIYGALSNGGDNVLKVQYGKNFENLEPLPAKAFDFYNAW